MASALFDRYKIHTVGIVWENISCVRVTPHVYTSCRISTSWWAHWERSRRRVELIQASFETGYDSTGCGVTSNSRDEAARDLPQGLKPA